MVPAIWETVYISSNDSKAKDYEKVFFALSLCFNLIYFTEAAMKIIGRGPNDYFCVQKANWIDIVVLILGVVDITLYLCKIKAASVFVFVKLLRVARGVRLLKPIVPRLILFVDTKINSKLFLGYDIGKGFVTAVDDVVKYLPQMVDHPKVLHKLKTVLERERLETVREMGIMQKDHPGIAIAVKTHHASRAVLNQMKESLTELKEDGLVDEKESDIMMAKLEENMKKLWKTPPSIAPAPPESLLQNVFWIGGRPEIFDFFQERAALISFAYGDTVYEVGQPSNGVYIITSGMVKIHYIPTEEIVNKFDNDGEIPCLELFADLTFRTSEDDFFSTGTVIGEQGVLTQQRRAGLVKCETSIFAYHIPESVMREALEKFRGRYSSLEACIWRAVGLRLALAVLPKHPAYMSWTLDKIRLRLEKSFVPIGDEFDSIKVYDFVADILIVQGKVKDSFSDDIFYAPQLIPRGVSKIDLIHTPTLKSRVLVIAFDETETVQVDLSPSQTSFLKHLEAVVEQGSRISERDRSSKSRHFSHRAKPRKPKRDLSIKPGFPPSVTKRSHRSKAFSTAVLNEESGDGQGRRKPTS
jgi:sodium/hydrogen exchanger 10/11